MNRKLAVIGAALVLVLGVAVMVRSQEQQATPPRNPSPEGAEVYIISPLDGEVVGRHFTVRFGLRGMGVAPSGIPMENTGHHHLLVDYEGLPPLDQPLPETEQSIHYGKGQTETVLELPPGEHTLQLVLGDMSHIPHDPPVISKKITVTVK